MWAGTETKTLRLLREHTFYVPDIHICYMYGVAVSRAGRADAGGPLRRLPPDPHDRSQAKATAVRSR